MPFTSEDPDDADVFSYTLVEGTGDSDNGNSRILTYQRIGDLRLGANLDFETSSLIYPYALFSTDAGGNSYEAPFAIPITNVNEPPLSIELDNEFGDGGAGLRHLVGNLSATDSDGTTRTPILWSGSEGATNNNLVQNL